MWQNVSTAKCHFQGSGINCMKGNVFSFNCVCNWVLKLKKNCFLFCTWNPFNCTWILRYFSSTTSRHDSTIHRHILKQSLNIFNTIFYFILVCIILYYLRDRALCIMSNFKQRQQFWTQLRLCTSIFIYFIPPTFKITFRYRNIIDKTYITWVDGISFLVITHLLWSVCWLQSNGPQSGRTSGSRRL